MCACVYSNTERDVCMYMYVHTYTDAHTHAHTEWEKNDVANVAKC